MTGKLARIAWARRCGMSRPRWPTIGSAEEVGRKARRCRAPLPPRSRAWRNPREPHSGWRMLAAKGPPTPLAPPLSSLGLVNGQRPGTARAAWPATPETTPAGHTHMQHTEEHNGRSRSMSPAGEPSRNPQSKKKIPLNSRCGGLPPAPLLSWWGRPGRDDLGQGLANGRADRTRIWPIWPRAAPAHLGLEVTLFGTLFPRLSRRSGNGMPSPGGGQPSRECSG